MVFLKSARFTVFIACIATALCCTQNELVSKLNELRDVISRKDTYQEEFWRRVSQLEKELGSASSDSLASVVTYRLFSEYQYFNTDSAKFYAARLTELGSETYPEYVFDAWKAAIDGEKSLFDNAFDRFDIADVPLSFRNDCYSILASSYLLIYPTTDEKLYAFMANVVRDSAMKTDLKEMFLGTMCMFEKRYPNAGNHFLLAYQTSETIHMKGRNAYLIAQSYHAMGRDDKYEYWLAQSAIHDFQLSIKAYSALQELSMAELSRGQYKTASKMIEVCMQDALFSRYWVRMNTAVGYESTIISALSRLDRKRIWGFGTAAAILLLMVVVLLMLLSMNSKQKKLLAETDKKKEEYIHKYIKLSLEYLGFVEKYRHKLRLLLREEGVDAVIAQLKIPSESESGYSDFYKEFDKTFLKIYPDFIRNVNSLLKPEARFEDVHTMNLPLRVLAAIRIGIKESRDIAVFLNCSPSSVYTYRSKMKANALSNKEDFESKICE